MNGVTNVNSAVSVSLLKFNDNFLYKSPERGLGSRGYVYLGTCGISGTDQERKHEAEMEE